MLGTLYSSASDFSSFSHHHDVFSHGFCLEQHETAIEERYCPNQHFPNGISDKDWDLLVAHETQLYDALQNDDPPSLLHPEDQSLLYTEDEAQPLPLMLPSSPLSRPYLDLLDTGYTTDADTDSGVPPSLAPSPTTSTFSGDVFDLPPTPVDDSFPVQVQTQLQSQPQVRTQTHSRKRGKPSGKPSMPRKRLCRASSSTSISTVSSLGSPSSSGSVASSTGSAPISSANAPLSIPNPNSTNPWKCPHCTWIQHTKRLPDFLRHQRSHFVSESDWPCPNPKCGKGFARKDSLKRHLDNRATGCKRPAGYSIC